MNPRIVLGAFSWLIFVPLALMLADDSTITLRTTAGTLANVRVNVTPGTDSDGAKLCVASGARTVCYNAVVGGERFQLDPGWDPVFRSPGKECFGLLFTALGEPFFSRQNKQMALLVLTSPKGELRDILPGVVLSEQSQQLMWDDARLSMMPILTTADFHWDMEREAHFGSHQYRINTYLFDGRMRYTLSDSYLTQVKYPGLDDVSQLDVIGKEMSIIQQHLSRRKDRQ